MGGFCRCGKKHGRLAKSKFIGGKMEQRWKYKNFNMGIELDIAGAFIYDGIHEFCRLKNIYNDGLTFTSLYNMAVGIERLEKIVYVLWSLDNGVDEIKFEKELITHSHTGLRDKIRKTLETHNENIEFSKQENALFELLCEFYNTARYMRFNINGDWNKELELIRTFLKSDPNYIETNKHLFCDNCIEVNENIKKLFGRTLKSIVAKYYELIRKGSSKNQTYTYELRAYSKASKIFYSQERSLVEDRDNEYLAVKELLIYLRNSKNKTGFLKYVDEIEPLEFDSANLITYLSDITRGIIPQELVDEVECLYEELDRPYEREKMVSLFAEENVMFEIPIQKECIEIINDVIEHHLVTEEEIKRLEALYDYVEDEYIQNLIIETKSLRNLDIQERDEKIQGIEDVLNNEGYAEWFLDRSKS